MFLLNNTTTLFILLLINLLEAVEIFHMLELHHPLHGELLVAVDYCSLYTGFFSIASFGNFFWLFFLHPSKKIDIIIISNYGVLVWSNNAINIKKYELITTNVIYSQAT